MIVVRTDGVVVTSCLYGTSNATLMKLENMQDNTKLEIPLEDVSAIDRFGLYCLAYDGSLQPGSSIIDDDVTYMNILPAKYIYTIYSGEMKLDESGIFYLKDNTKNNIITYESKRNSKIYNG